MIKKVFLRGLVAVLPVAITAYAVWWFFVSAETLMRELVIMLVGAEEANNWYVPGLGLVVALVFVFCVGVLMHLWVFRSVYQWATKTLDRLPLVKSVYGMVKDFTSYLGGGDGKARMDQVVTYELKDGIRLIGFVTRSSLDDLPTGLGPNSHIAVYLPMSYQIGGYTIYCARNQVEPLDMSFEEAMRLAMTAGVSAQS